MSAPAAGQMSEVEPVETHERIMGAAERLKAGGATEPRLARGGACVRG